MVKVRDVTAERRKELPLLEKNFSTVKQHFPFLKGFFVVGSLEGSCRVYELFEGKILDISFASTGTSNLTLRNPYFYNQAYSLAQDMERRGLETFMKVDYNKPKLVLKPLW